MRLSKWAMTAPLAMIATIGVPSAPTRATSVQPVIVNLAPGGRRMSAIVEVENSFKSPLPVEIRMEEGSFVDGELKPSGKDTDDLMVFPPQALIQPGRNQNFRVQYVGDPALAQSRHYFLTVAQLPVQLPEGQTAVQVLYNFQVIVSVAVPGAKPSIAITGTEISTTGDGKPRAVLLLENNSDTYGFLSDGQLHLTQKDASGKEIFNRTLTPITIQDEIGYGLIGAHQKRRLTTSIIVPDAGGKLEAEFAPDKR